MKTYINRDESVLYTQISQRVCGQVKEVIKVRRREIAKRAAAVMLAASMVFTSSGLDGMRTDARSANNTDVGADSGDSRVITLFAELPEDIRVQKLAPGAGESDIKLPDKLTAEVRAEDKDRRTGTETTAETTTTESAVTETATTETSTTETADTGTATARIDAPETTSSETTGTTSINAGSGAVSTGGAASETAAAATQQTVLSTEAVRVTEQAGNARRDEQVSTLLRSDSSTAAESTGELQTAVKTEEVTINDVTWKLDNEKSDSDKFSSDEADYGSVYVYEPVLPDGYTTADGVSLPEIKVQITDGIWAFVKSVYVDGVKITVMAEEGVFPRNADMKASKVTSEAQNEKIEAAVTGEADKTAGNKNASVDPGQLITYDISVHDENGNETEPDNSRGKVKVVFGKLEEAASDDGDIHVYHMDDADSRPEELNTSVDSSDGSVSVETQHFSLFTVVLSTANTENTAKKDTVTITNDPSKVYDGTPVEDPSVTTQGGGAVTFRYYQGTDATGTALGSAPTNAGSYTVVAHEAATANYAASDSEPQAFTIIKRKVALGLQPSLASGVMTLTAVVIGVLDGSGSVKFDYISPSGPGTNNVKISLSSMEYSAVTSIAYDGSVSTGSISVTATYIDASGNYSGSSASEKFNVALETRSITDVHAINLTYGDNPVSLNPKASVNGNKDSWTYGIEYDTNSDLGNTVYVDKDGEVKVDSAGISFIKITLVDGNNHYANAYAYVPVTVSPKKLTVKPSVTDSSGKTVTSVPYGQAGNLKYGLTYSGFTKPSEYSDADNEGTYTKGHGSLSLPGLTNTTDVGIYPLYLARNGADLTIYDTSYTNVFYCSNYAFTFAPASLTVTPVAPTLTVSSKDMMIGWGRAFLPVSANAAGANGETVSGNLSWSESSGGAAIDDTWKFSGTAGDTKKLYWTFTPSNNKNYTTVSGSTDFKLKNKNAVSVKLAADKQSGVTYGDPVTYRASLVNTDNASEAMTGDLKLYLGDSSTGVLLGQTTDASPVSVTVDKTKLVPGSHKVTAVYDGCDYYRTATADITTEVAKREITASADDLTMTAGGALPEFTVSYSGIVSGENASDIFKTQAEASCTADGKTAGKYPITVTAPVLTESAEKLYTLGTPVNGTLTVQPAPQDKSNDDNGGSSSTQDDQPAVKPDKKPVKKPSQDADQLRPAGGEQNTDSNTVHKKAGGNNSNADNGNTKTAEPVIKGDSGTAGWDAIKTQIGSTGEGKMITVEMNGTGTVPGEVLSSIKGRDVTLTIDMGNGISWSINGKDVTSDSIPDIDFTVNKGSDTIPADVINKVTGERYSMNISIAYSGKFGFKATLSVNMGEKNKGLYANLFYFNPDTKALEFMTYGKIAADGAAKLDFEHASDYTIVIDKTPMDGSMTASDKSTVKQQTGTAETEESAEPAQNSSHMTPTDVIVLVCVIIALCLAAGYFICLRKKDSGDGEE